MRRQQFNSAGIHNTIVPLPNIGWMSHSHISVIAQLVTVAQPHTNSILSAVLDDLDRRATMHMQVRAVNLTVPMRDIG